MKATRDALHAGVRRLCGDKSVVQCVLMEDAALVELPKSVALLTVSDGKIRVLWLTNRQAYLMAKHLAAIFQVA